MHILVVDDEPFISEVLAMVLKKAGHRVKIAADGAQALAALVQEAFDAVITDWAMPGMDGMVLAREIKARNAGQKIILLTGTGAHNQRSENIDFVLGKPVDTDKLLEILSSLNVPG